jgi:hypothetical protein
MYAGEMVSEIGAERDNEASVIQFGQSLKTCLSPQLIAEIAAMEGGDSVRRSATW